MSSSGPISQVRIRPVATNIREGQRAEGVDRLTRIIRETHGQGQWHGLRGKEDAFSG
jgi:hypothetical protein